MFGHYGSNDKPTKRHSRKQSSSQTRDEALSRQVQTTITPVSGAPLQPHRQGHETNYPPNISSMPVHVVDGYGQPVAPVPVTMSIQQSQPLVVHNSRGETRWEKWSVPSVEYRTPYSC